MRNTIYIIFCFFSIPLLGQTFSENDIEKLAKQINQKIKDVDLDNGTSGRSCIAIGRTLIYQYNVPDYWQAPFNIKEEIILNLKSAGTAKTFFLQNINIEYQYYTGNSLIKRVVIKSNELSTFNLELGEYLSIKDHPKAKEVNLKVRVPVGWEVKEGDRPNVVKKFVNEGNTYLILIKENITFFSRKQIRELLQDNNYVSELIHEVIVDLKDSQIIDQSIISIDTYPTVQFKAKVKLEIMGLTMPFIMKSWVVFYEDKVVFLQAMGLDNSEFRVLEQLYTLITNSVVFPEQYN